MISPVSNLPERDLERLSAYLDGDLSPREVGALEARLRDDQGLRQSLAELRAVVGAVRRLPSLRPPRNFTLRPEAARRPSASYPVLRFATLVASALFVLTTVVRAAPLRGFSLGAMAPAAPAAEMAAEDSLSMQAPAEPTAGKAMGTPVTGAELGAVSATSEPAMESRTAAPTEAALAEAPAVTACPECPDALALAPEAASGEAEQTLRTVEIPPSSAGFPLAAAQWSLGLAALALLILTVRARRR